jgi:hypothetical protein
VSIKNCMGSDRAKAGSQPSTSRHFQQTKHLATYMVASTGPWLFSRLTWNAVSARGATLPFCEGPQRESGDVVEFLVHRVN